VLGFLGSVSANIASAFLSSIGSFQRLDAMDCIGSGHRLAARWAAIQDHASQRLQRSSKSKIRAGDYDGMANFFNTVVKPALCGQPAVPSIAQFCMSYASPELWLDGRRQANTCAAPAPFDPAMELFKQSKRWPKLLEIFEISACARRVVALPASRAGASSNAVLPGAVALAATAARARMVQPAHVWSPVG
jgi:hypothetical protein